MKEATTKINRVNSRHSIYLQKGLVEDSAFPFKPGDPLFIKIVGNKLVIEKAQIEEK